MSDPLHDAFRRTLDEAGAFRRPVLLLNLETAKYLVAQGVDLGGYQIQCDMKTFEYLKSQGKV